MFTIYLASLCKKLFARRGLWRYWRANELIARACGLSQVPDRRLVEIAPQAEVQIRHLSLVLTVEGVTNGSTAASDGSVFAARGRCGINRIKKWDVFPMA